MEIRDMRLEFSRRYAVVGIYKDRSRPTVRVYPLPGVRLSIFGGRTCMHGWIISDNKRRLDRCEAGCNDGH